jgi:zinc protease
MMAEVEKVLAEGFTEEEVRRARNKLAADAIYARDSQAGMANLFGGWLAIGGTVEELISYPEDVRAVTPEAAIAALRDVFGPGKNYIEAHLLTAEGDL